MVDIFLEIAGCPFGALADTSLWRSVSHMKRHLVIAPCVQTSWWGLAGQVRGAVMPGMLLP